MVSAILRWSRRRGGNAATETPHLHGGTDLDKVRYEYESPDVFWDIFESRVSLSTLKDRDVVDIGCGWGGKDIRYAEESGLRALTGFDLPGLMDPAAPSSFALERGVTNCTFITGVAEDQPFADESFDIGIVDDVLEHVSDPERVIAEGFRILRPGGLLLVKFPSMRMMSAHHLDRAVSYPGLHYLLPFRVWAGGLNHCLLESDGALGYEPFDEVRPTAFRKEITANLNGQSMSDFRDIVDRSGFETVLLRIVPFEIAPTSPARRLARAAHQGLCRIPVLEEFFGTTIAYVGRKPAVDSATTGTAQAPGNRR